MKPKMLTIGAGTQDIFLSGEVFATHLEDGQKVEEFVVGNKYEVENVTFSTGGGATNAAVTFARQGLKVSFMGKLAHDPAGMAIIADLHNEGVDTSLIAYSKKYSSGYSTLLLSPGGERAVLVYRGASTSFNDYNFDMSRVGEADWIYISSLAGRMEFLKTVVHRAKKGGAKVAINPGSLELKAAAELKACLEDCDVLIANKDEVAQLFAGKDSDELVRNASELTPTVIVTDGPKGAVATDRKEIVHAGMYEDVPVIDRTGAGDAFGSGFVASLAQGKSLTEAVTFASANSTSVVGKIGAKAGILKANARLHEMPLKIKPF